MRRLRPSVPLRLLLPLALAACGIVRDVAIERHSISAVPETGRPRVLCVVAHPDDEISFAGTLYKASTLLGAACDVLTITNGEAGFRYSTLAERIYGLELTNEEVGRAHLPAIRRDELRLGVAYLGVRELLLLNQKDDGYSKDRKHVLDPATSPWDLARVRSALDEVLARGGYDFVLTHLPSEEAHGHHQSATLLAIEAVERMPPAARPVVLGARGLTRTEQPPKAPYAGLPGEPSTLPLPGARTFEFDRTQKFGHDNRLDYKIVVNWAIAAHKSQGTMQLGMNRTDVEEYWLFAFNGDGAVARAGEFFDKLKAPQYASASATPAAAPP